MAFGAPADRAREVRRALHRLSTQRTVLRDARPCKVRAPERPSRGVPRRPPTRRRANRARDESGAETFERDTVTLVSTSWHPCLFRSVRGRRVGGLRVGLWRKGRGAPQGQAGSRATRGVGGERRTRQMSSFVTRRRGRTFPQQAFSKFLSQWESHLRVFGPARRNPTLHTLAGSGSL